MCKKLLFQLMCVEFNEKKNMHAIDKQTRNLLSAVTLSRLLPELHFCNFITSHYSSFFNCLISSYFPHLTHCPYFFPPHVLACIQ